MRFYIFLLFLLIPMASQATVRMSLTAGTPCEGCHYQQNGGGGRTEMGWESMNKSALLTYDKIGLTRLHKQNSSSLVHRDSLQITPGFDFRMQGARLGIPTYQFDATTKQTEVVNPDFSWIPMQAQAYLGMVYKNLTVYGSFSPSKKTGTSTYCNSTPYPGMTCYQAFIGYKITPELKIRAGRFMPSIGMQYDDHTMMVRSAIGFDQGSSRRGYPVIPPTFAEFGAEINYQPMRWMKLDLGVFDTKNLKSSINSLNYTASADRPLINARLTFFPHISIGGEKAKKADDFDDFDAPPPSPPQIIHSWFGASIANTTDFNMINSFMGLGIPQGLSLVVEHSYNQRLSGFKTNNIMASLFYAPKTWISFHIRAERAKSQYHSDFNNTISPMLSPTMNQYVAGLEFFPIPYVEIRPEYRWIETPEYRFAYASLQFHVFY